MSNKFTQEQRELHNILEQFQNKHNFGLLEYLEVLHDIFDGERAGCIAAMDTIESIFGETPMKEYC